MTVEKHELEKLEKDVENISREVESLSSGFVTLRQAFEVHITAETGARALAIEKLETLKLALENSALKQSSELATASNMRITKLESELQEAARTAAAHIESCTKENEELKKGRLERQRSQSNLWIAISTTAFLVVAQFVFQMMNK